MDPSNYEIIKKKHGQFSSWAIWNDTTIIGNDGTLIENSIDQLHSEFVIVGFNASRNLAGNWMNFHMPHQGGRDNWLAEIFNKEPFRGAYMTDLLKTDKENKKVNTSKSLEVERKFFQPENLSDLINSRTQKQSFKEEMELVGSNENTTFILIGDLTRRYFDCFTDFRYPKKKHLPHYAGRLTRHEWIEQCVNIFKNETIF